MGVIESNIVLISDAMKKEAFSIAFISHHYSIIIYLFMPPPRILSSVSSSSSSSL